MDGSHGQRRRRQILEAAVDLSSAEGLSELSIGRLAAEIGISKSGLFAHFGSKQELQLATVRHAALGYTEHVIAPAETAAPGLGRLRALVDRWAVYIAGTPNRGGCFFDAASTEFSSRPGLVRDLLAKLSGDWLCRLTREAALAVRLGELAPNTDSELLAFQLHACIAEANWARELLGDPHSFRMARRAVAHLLAVSAGDANSGSFEQGE